MARRKPPVTHGLAVVDKPAGVTSHDVVAQLRRRFDERQVGHAGTLDPDATGVLLVGVGKATKLLRFLTALGKSYTGQVRLGVTTDTLDSAGSVTATFEMGGVSVEDARRLAAAHLTGPIMQVPPMVSALKLNGTRLHELARQGIEVERESRRVTIHSMTLTQWDAPFLELNVHCSKGTYVRTLAEDLGHRIGCGAHVVGLRRTSVGPYGEETGFVTLDELERLEVEGFSALDALLLPMETALGQWPEVVLSEATAFYLRMGQAVMVPQAPTEGWVRIRAKSGELLGVGFILEDGKVQPKRLINQD